MRRLRKELLQAAAAALYTASTAFHLITLLRPPFYHIVSRSAIVRISDPYILSHRLDALLTLPMLALAARNAAARRDRGSALLLLLVALGPAGWVPVPGIPLLQALASAAGMAGTGILAYREGALAPAADLLASALIALEAYSVAHWAAAILRLGATMNPGAGPASVELELFHSLDPLIPLLTLAMIYSWLVYPATGWRGLPRILVARLLSLIHI